jgi:ABC-type multidrug transport system ATPase subunit
MLLRPFGGSTVEVVSSVSCEVHRGEFFGVLGPNGAGKSTLFKMLATSIAPDAGTAVVAGIDVVREPRRVREVLASVATEERSLNWRLSARENLRLFAMLHGQRQGEWRRRVEDVLEAVELADTGEKIVAQFSSGMRQRLLIARALLGRPRVLLLDEPTRSLDPISARRFRRFLRDELIDRQRCTVILATHNSEEALELCDRVTILDRGRLLTVGSAARIAAEVQGEHYLVWVRATDESEVTKVTADAGVTIVAKRPDAEPGWLALELELHGGVAGAAGVLGRLSAAGVAVARFERLQLPLADLIEQVVRQHGSGSAGDA